MSNPVKPLNQSQLRLLHYFNLSHAQTDVPLSRLYSLLYSKEEENQQMMFPAILSQKFCLKCGTLFIPGLSVTLKVIYKTNKKDKKSQRRLRFRCLSCRNNQYEDDLIQNKPVVEKKVIPMENDTKLDTPVEKVVVKSKAKERSKKRKMTNNLSNMLQEKKKQKTEESKLGSMNLMEFLK
ncbi:SNM1 Ribonuclease MRP protein subunit SNM1 [Candida maltosa Xu316]|uniref:Uncharacterized protein n=1 Tax=Candida maltosa (strain Xu316) TaxID=1245528 RepID=M3JU64_CANMX|nr:hypothetical protein G210_3342 [Candida maltosa Xu316]